MSEIAIIVENLSKRYIIGHQRAKGDGSAPCHRVRRAESAAMVARPEKRVLERA